MYFIYIQWPITANLIFAISLLFFVGSLTLSLIEIQLSTKALELELSDMEGLEDPSVVEYFKRKLGLDKE
jgi:hypothetical protein